MKIVCQRVAAIVEGSTALSLLSLSLTLSISLSLYAILFGFGLVSWVEIFKSKIYLIKYLTASLAAA